MPSFYEDKPTEEFLAKLAAFTPEHSAVQCSKEMVELLVILTNAPMLVRDCMHGFLKGHYMSHLVALAINDNDLNPEIQSSSQT